MTISAELLQTVEETIADWEAEAKLWEGWRDVPVWLSASRRRLATLVELDAPESIVATEVNFTRERTALMRGIRMKGLH